ncbi:MAG: hypothetical protein MJZ68_10140 [archaeon]|nr:hypothetical protein [archaeon]
MSELGISSRENDDGTTHYTVYSTENNIRYSWDQDDDGNRTNRHITDQDDNEHLNLPDCAEEDDDVCDV